jgi:hypothetical protein
VIVADDHIFIHGRLNRTSGNIDPLGSGVRAGMVKSKSDNRDAFLFGERLALSSFRTEVARDMAKGVSTLLELSLRVLEQERHSGRACPTRGHHAPQWRAIKVGVKYVPFVPVPRSPVHVLDERTRPCLTVSSPENIKNWCDPMVAHT